MIDQKFINLILHKIIETNLLYFFYFMLIVNKIEFSQDQLTKYGILI